MIDAYLPSLEAFSTKLLCPSLASFRFSQDAVLSLDLINPIDEEIPRRPNAHLRNEDDEMTGDNGLGGDFGGGDDDIFAGQDFGGGGDEGEGMYGGNTDGADDFFASEEGVYGQNGGGGRGSGEMEDFDPRRSGGDERDLVMSVDGSGEQTFDYLDSALGNKNWAGPEHWKMSRKVVRKGEPYLCSFSRTSLILDGLQRTLPLVATRHERRKCPSQSTSPNLQRSLRRNSSLPEEQLPVFLANPLRLLPAEEVVDLP